MQSFIRGFRTVINGESLGALMGAAVWCVLFILIVLALIGGFVAFLTH